MKNRELKFRVWDVKNKRFLAASDIAINGNGNLLITDSGWYENFENQNLSEYVVQQFTGEYDKNNTPIYEGDVVKCKRPEIWLQEDFDEREAGIVTYFNASFHITEKYTGKPIKGSVSLIEYKSLTDPYLLECEVIGNIFQNYELLNNESNISKH